MDPGKQITGTRDEHYNLIAVLYHALHGAENCELYAADAEVAGREELAAFFLEAPAEGPTVGRDVPPDTTPVDVRGRVAPEVGLPSETPTDVPPEIPGDVPLGPSVSQDVPPETEDVPRMEGDATVGRDIPPETTPEDSPLRSADVQREEQVRADQVSVPTERPIGDVPPQVGD